MPVSQPEYEVCSLDDIPPDGMREIAIDGRKVLLVREDDTVHAIAATCPHAGAPLVEGVRHGQRLVCPWHKATFCIRTGDVLEPPALDPLPRFGVRLDGRRVLLRMPAEPDPADPTAAELAPVDARCFVIVGAGATGAVAAQTLRQAGFAGRVIMLDQENRIPYDRTLLSKYHLSGEHGAEKSPLQKQSFYHQHRIERRTARVTAIDVTERRITCADGSTVPYDAALLATGGTPVRPSLPGADLGNVFLLRSRADADAILAQAERSERAVILGASFIGMEVAASLRERGLAITVVGTEQAPFEQRLGGRIGSVFRSLHERHGVTFRLGRKVAALRGGADVTAVVLDDGEVLATDLVVIGFGVAPATPVIRGLDRNEDGSVTVDAQLRAAEGLYAAGDIARFPNRGDGEPVRVEHWRVAEQQGGVAARNMAGAAVRYDAVPVFWTIQYLKRLDYVGHATSWDAIEIHGDLEKPQFLAYYVKDGLVVAAIAFDRDTDSAAMVELFSLRRDWTPAALGAHPAAVLAALDS